VVPARLTPGLAAALNRFPASGRISIKEDFAMSCSICTHPQRQAIDLALLNRTATLTVLGQQHRLSKSALHRHKQHLLKKVAQAKDRFQDMLKEGYLLTLNKLLERVQRLAHKAEAEDNSRLLLQAVRQGTSIIKFMAKLEDSLRPETVCRLLASPQWTASGSLLPTEPGFLAACHQALADSFFSPCPEPDDEDDSLAEPADLTPELLSGLLAGLSQSLGSSGSQPHPAGWEKGGKKSGKTAVDGIKKQNNQSVSRETKSFGKNPRPPAVSGPQPDAAELLEAWDPKLLTPDWVQDLDAGRLDVATLNAIGAGRLSRRELSRSGVAP
jgi:hypothetical protein